MDINHLRDFVILAQTGNFMEAAEQLYSSQSTLSKHIKSIEKELGVPLFDRTTRKVAISKYGQMLLPYAQKIVELQEQYNFILQGSLRTNEETLTLGSIPALAQYKITDVIVNFKKSRPQFMINVMQAGSQEMKELLRQKKIELAFIRYIDEVDDDFIKLPYAVDTMVAVLPTNHPLAGQKTISLQLLSDENFLLTAKQTMLYKLSISACQQCGFEPKVAYTDHNLENLAELVIKGMGVALLMKQLALHISSPKISIVDISPSITTQISLCYLKDAKLSPAAKHFLQCAKSQKSSLHSS